MCHVCWEASMKVEESCKDIITEEEMLEAVNENFLRESIQRVFN